MICGLGVRLLPAAGVTADGTGDTALTVDNGALASLADEPHVVTELRFVPPKPDTQLRVLYEAWNKADDLNVESDEDGEDEGDADDAQQESKGGDSAQRNSLLRGRQLVWTT